MQVESNFSPSFLDGFVKRCQDMGLDEGETESMFQIHTAHDFIGREAVGKGFQKRIRESELPRTKLAKYLTPGLVALAAHNTMRFGEGAFPSDLRKSAAVEEPTWECVPDSIKEAVAHLSIRHPGFDTLPIGTQVLTTLFLDHFKNQNSHG